MADLQRLFFGTPASVSDREILATARLNARVKAFLGRELRDDMPGEDMLREINAAVADEMERLVTDGVLREKPDWLAVLVSRRLHVAFGSSAVQQLSRELKQMGVV
jgi:phage-related baseplate assembly protein